MVILDRYGESCNTLEDLTNRICISNNMITGINYAKTFVKHILWNCK